MSKEIAIFLTGAIVPIGVWLCVLHHRFLLILKTGHTENWKAMGMPKVLLAKTIDAEISVTRYLFSRGYQALSNPVLNLVGDDLRMAHFLFVSSIVGSIVFNIINLATST